MEKKTNKEMSQENSNNLERPSKGFFWATYRIFHGFVIVGYRAGDHPKFAYVDGRTACSDALNFFIPP